MAGEPADLAVLARAGLDWLLGMAVPTDAGLAWPATQVDDIDSTLYSGESYSASSPVRPRQGGDLRRQGYGR